MRFAICVAAGLFAGILSSMGFGGGTVLVMIMTGFLGIDQLSAQGINLLCFIPVAAASLVFHFIGGNVDKRSAARIIPFGLTGSVIGAFAAKLFSKVMPLKILFAAFILVLGIIELFGKNANRS